MPKPQIDQEITNKQETEEPDFKGTFISVMLLGGFLIITWLGVWILFLVR